MAKNDVALPLNKMAKILILWLKLAGPARRHGWFEISKHYHRVKSIESPSKEMRNIVSEWIGHKKLLIMKIMT